MLLKIEFNYKGMSVREGFPKNDKSLTLYFIHLDLRKENNKALIEGAFID